MGVVNGARPVARLPMSFPHSVVWIDLRKHFAEQPRSLRGEGGSSFASCSWNALCALISRASRRSPFNAKRSFFNFGCAVTKEVSRTITEPAGGSF